MEYKIGFILIGIGIVSFIGSLIIWFWFYPKRKRFLNKLKKKLRLECPKGALVFRRGKLKGVYREHEIVIIPFVSEMRLWILVKFHNPKNFLASIKSRKGMFFSLPISKKGREEIFTGNTDFDRRFRVFGKPTSAIQRILPPLIQKQLIKLAKKENFEIQILQDGISYVSESKTRDVDLTKFILDLLIGIANNITFL